MTMAFSASLRSIWTRFRAGLVATLLAALVSPTVFAQANPNQGPGGPILVVTSSTATFSKFYAEILRNEGLNSFAVADVSTLSAAALAAYDTVILGDVALTSTQVSTLTTWVSSGGNLIAMKPDAQLASLLGVTSAGSTLSDRYLRVDTSNPIGAGIASASIQYHGAASLYTLNGATALATLYTDASTASSNPAVTLRSIGTSGGQAAMFSYDLARSIVYTRQGNPAWAGQDRDSQFPVRSDDMFYGNSPTDPQADWVDLSKVAIAQADEQQRFLANLIISMNLDRKPLPRFWYFPNAYKAAVVMTGDDHGTWYGGTGGSTAQRFDQFANASTPGCNVDNWECVRGTSYLFSTSVLTPAQAISYNAAGFEVGVHILTGVSAENDCLNFTQSSLTTIYDDQIQAWQTKFAGLPAPKSVRHHCIVWSDWVSAAKVQLAHGIRLDTDYYYWPPGWVNDVPGQFTGSAMPMRFADTDGSLVDVYQAVTQMTDESGQTYPFTVDTLLDRAVGPEEQYGVFTVNAHTDLPTTAASDSTLVSAQARGVPIVSARQMLTWLDGRNASTFGSLSWNANALSFTVTQASGANGLRGLLPRASANGVINSLTRGGSPVTLTNITIKGVNYVAFPATSGNYVATYTADTTPPTISTRAPAASATNVSVSTSVAVTFSEALNPSTVSTSTIELRAPGNVLVPATVSYDQATSIATLQPSVMLAGNTAYTVNVKGGSTPPNVQDLTGNALAATATWTFTTGAVPACSPCSVYSPSAVPGTPDGGDGAAVELGVQFRPLADGQITGVRFYKSAANTGVHVGHLFSAGGSILASGTFINETASGWQELVFSTPVAVTANTVYTASYYAPNGHYSVDEHYFDSGDHSSAFVHLLTDSEAGGNGVFAYGSGGVLPVDSFNASSYWVDVLFVGGSGTADTTPPTVTAKTPAAGGTVAPSTAVTVTFSEAMASSTINTSTIVLTNPSSATVPATVAFNASTNVATLTPTAALAASTVYTATVKGGTTAPVVTDLAGNKLAANVSWTFTTTAGGGCPCTLWPATTIPVVASESDGNSVQLGVKFRADVAGFVTGIRFYKGTANTGTHIGTLWASTGGSPLASATFQSETTSGWQEVQFSSPVSVQANTTYIAAYYAPNGNYAADSGYFSGGVDNGVLHAPSDASASGNGVYIYGSSSDFPNQTWGSTNYWVQPVFVSAASDTATPTVTITSPTTGGTYSTTSATITLAGTSSDDTGVVGVNWTNSLGGSGNATGTSSWSINNVVLTSGLNTITVAATDTSGKVGTAILKVTYTPAVDTTPPVVLAVAPAAGGTGIPVSSTVTAVFNEAMQAASIGTSSFELRTSSGTLVPATVSYNVSTFTATLTPSSALAVNTTYTAKVLGGTTDPRAKDAAGNALASNFTWTFSTGGLTGCSANAVAQENCLTGNLQTEWDVTGAGDTSIQGFATQISVNRGQAVQFKVDTDATSYRFDIYRMGYYGGRGARKVDSVLPTATLPQGQDPCMVQTQTTGLIDCGNWKVSGSWTVPATAVSGIYFAKVTRTDSGHSGQASHIFFIVRDDASTSKMVFQTSDTTWQAYNTYGGNSLYVGGPAVNPNRAYKVSYNRPFATRGNDGGQDFVFNAEYPMVRFLEQNGYDVTYISGVDSDRTGSLLLNHKMFLSVGHDEYWSGQQRANVEAARAAGVHLAFFSGNEVFWKTRWENSIDSSNTPYRTLVVYKETHANGKIDPTSTWTGTWRDGRFSPPSDGGRPENALTGVSFRVNAGTSGITVPAQFAKMRLWRGTTIANLTSGSAAFPDGTLGYEWDEAPNNGLAPGVVRMSSTTVSNVQVLTDLGSTYESGTATHALTLYKHASGALVFGAGTVQWAWGLDSNHDRSGTPIDQRMQQATVNLFADMGVQPSTLMSGLSAASPSTDVIAPTVSIASPASGSTVQQSSTVTLSGTAVDSGGGIVGAVEVSTDGGTTWTTASGTTTWTYSWRPTTLGSTTVKVRAVDDSANIQSSPTNITLIVATSVPVNCPCSLWSTSTVPGSIDDNDAQQVQTGVKFTADSAGTISAIRFYKGALNTGTHIGTLWSSTGTPLATVTFTNETASGWQQQNLTTPITIQPNTTYVVSYYSPNGHYPGEDNYFTGVSVNTGPLHAPASESIAGGNGVYAYGGSSTFPDQTYQGENYWVDVVFNPSGGSGDTTAPTVAFTSPTTGTTYTASAPTLNLAGTSADAVGVTQVTWANSAGGTGTATGTTTWSVSNIALVSGTNNITVSSRDAAGNVGMKVLAVTYTPAVADTTNPLITITTPVNAATFSTSSATLALGGTSSDNVGVTQVTWTNSVGGSGTATGTANWSAASIALTSGLNTITVTARDAAGNLATDILAVTYTPAADTTKPSVTITSPTSNSTTTTTATTLTVGGTASDNVAVTQVTWSSTAGVSGTATGTTSWTATSIPMVSGSQTITVTARDAAGNTQTDTLVVTASISADNTNPTVTITSPTSSTTTTVTANTVNIGGTASDNRAVKSVSWSNSRGGSGTATGTTSWTASGVALQPGSNVLTVKATDTSNRTSTDTLTVTFNAPLTYGMVAAYSFNEGAGATVQDATGNNNLGTVTNGSWTNQGKFGNALVFNGTTSRLFVNNSASINLTTGMTLMAWVYPTSSTQTNNRTIMRRESNGYWLYGGRTSNTLRPGGGAVIGSATKSVATTSALPVNTWSHVAMTYDGSNVVLYVNGTAVNTVAATGNIVSGTSALWIGGNAVLGEYFQGRIDEVRVYNRALSATDLGTARNTAITP
ncbi:MAG: DUF4082 domain-containing protein [Gammaproteobacteria bacterium]